MRATRPLSIAAAAAAVVALMALGAALGTGQQGGPGARPTGFIQGQVTSGDGPEAGVWVIAETTDLPTPAYRKIVVTNAQGRFVLPELPEADYQVWVRGYGLRDSAKVPASVGGAGPNPNIDIAAEVATTPQERAAHYPANYWLSLFRPPANTEALPGMRNKQAWMSDFKLGCMLCHQMGSASARGMMGDRARLDAGLLKSGVMNGTAIGLGRDAVLDALADWGGRIAAGQVPEAPPRPSGIERNFVVTQWQWGLNPALYTYAHDEIATDKRNPTLYPDGKIWGVDLGNDRLLSVDPLTHEADEKKVPTLDPTMPPWNFATLGQPAPGGVTEHLGAYQNPANPHNPMMDDTGKVWMTTAVRPDNPPPAFCSTPPGPNAEHRAPPTRTNVGHRQLGYYDTNADEFVLIHTCYGTHHLQFDQEGVLWLSGDNNVFGWFDPAKFDPARPRETESDAQGWSQIRVDSNGDGTADTNSNGFNYGIITNPVDDTVWTGRPGNPGNIVRYDPDADTAGQVAFEVYRPPAPGGGPRGVDVDTKGIIWAGLGGTGHLAKFDRSKCARTWGTGDQCPEGWTLYKSPGPSIATGAENSADFHYYLWVDQFNTLGMGVDTVILNGTDSDSLLAFDPQTEKFTVIRVPYPKNLFTRGLDGRIDDPDTGWKGRGLWFDNGGDPVLHSEVQRSYAGHVQLRPNPLAR